MRVYRSALTARVVARWLGQPTTGRTNSVLVLAEGRLEASGTHAELMAQGGRYAELFELQAAGYR